jgi:hypothetical protein
VIWLQGDTAWPLVAFSWAMAVIVLIAQCWLRYWERMRG